MHEPNEALIDVVGHMLSDGAFVIVDPDPDPTPVEGHRTEVRFGGPASGSIVVEAPLGLGLEIAQNLAPPEEPPSPETAAEALREMANMITGALLPRVFGGEHVFHLGIPTPLTPIEVTPPAQCAHQVGLVSEEGNRIRVCLRLDEEGGRSP
ncbi:MAG: chemotaxis protein CheX [Myxococcota bacterium]